MHGAQEQSRSSLANRDATTNPGLQASGSRRERGPVNWHDKAGGYPGDPSFGLALRSDTENNDAWNNDTENNDA
jgi:hypothetical protein